MKFRPESEIMAILKEAGEKLGITVEEVRLKHGKDPSLTVFIDREGGIDLDACEAFHNAIDAPLDELDPTYGEPYTLNVSSLGVDRPFKTDRDFEKHLGFEVEVKLNAPIRGKKFLEGVLTYFDETTIRLKVSEKEEYTIERKKINKINEAIKFD